MLSTIRGDTFGEADCARDLSQERFLDGYIFQHQEHSVRAAGLQGFVEHFEPSDRSSVVDGRGTVDGLGLILLTHSKSCGSLGIREE